MVSIPYALSVSHFINTVGADAGFAAIIGLALLVLLFFAQMRETSHLRDQVADATDHVSHLEYQLTQLSRGGGGAPAVTPAPGVAPRPASVPVTGSAPAVPAAVSGISRAPAPAPPRGPVVAPIAPAGVGAPALASATRLIPAFDDGPISVRQSAAAAVSGAAGATATATAAADVVASAQGHGPGRPDGAVIDPPGPPPATPAGGANGSTTGRATPPPAGAGAPRAGQAGRPPEPRNAGRSSGASAPRRTNYGPEPRSRLRGLLGALIALGVVAAIVVVLLVLTGGSSSPTASSSSTAKASNAPTGHRRTHRAAAIKPASVTIVVLNGTSTTGLAGDVSAKLTGDGYKLGTPHTASDQTHATTLVAYQPGHRAAALIVAKSLGLGASAVSAVDQGSLAVACPPGALCTAQVIVTAGANLASVASSSTAAAPGTAAGPAAATSTG